MRNKIKSWWNNAMPNLICSALIGIITVFIALHQSSSETKLQMTKMYGELSERISVLQESSHNQSSNQQELSQRMIRIDDKLNILVERKHA